MTHLPISTTRSMAFRPEVPLSSAKHARASPFPGTTRAYQGQFRRRLVANAQDLSVPVCACHVANPQYSPRAAQKTLRYVSMLIIGLSS